MKRRLYDGNSWGYSFLVVNVSQLLIYSVTPDKRIFASWNCDYQLLRIKNMLHQVQHHVSVFYDTVKHTDDCKLNMCTIVYLGYKNMV